MSLRDLIFGKAADPKTVPQKIETGPEAAERRNNLGWRALALHRSILAIIEDPDRKMNRWEWKNFQKDLQEWYSAEIQETCRTRFMGAGVGAKALEYSMMRQAIIYNNMAVIPMLIEAGADLNQPDAITGHLALQDAAELGTAEMIEFLHAQGADLQAKDWLGVGILPLAKDERTEELLLRLGAVPAAQIAPDDPSVDLK